jgi:acyl-CoA synthetase (AMP-forming)/AMP-acid ligase II
MIDTGTADSVYGALAATANAHAAAPFLHVPASALPERRAFDADYGATLDAVDALAARYRARGYGPGHRVALLLENRPAFLLHYLALNAVGASAVPLNPDYRASELEYVLRHSEAVLAVALDAQAPRLAAFGIAVVTDTAFDPPAASAARSAARHGLDAECALLYTSGTTGTPKGCLLSNRYALGIGRHYVTEGGLCTVRRGAERLITPLPLFHMNALVCSTTAMILAAGCVIQLDRFHPQTWWADVAASGATIVHYLGVMPAILLAQPPRATDREHVVRFGYGANANPRDHAAFEARFGFPLIESWAMTETGGGAVITASREPRHVGTRCIGSPRAGIDVRIVDEAGSEVADGAPGELLVRRAGADPRAGFCSGYLKDDAATEAAWRGGWFHTGDAVRRGPDGQLHFVDRRRNIIRRAGENVAALEVEAALAGHPAVRQVAVIAVPDALRDEEVMACVVTHDAAHRTRAAAESIQDWCLERLAYFKAPGYVVFVDAVPTTATNKVQKARLADVLKAAGAADTDTLDPLAVPDCHDLRLRKRRDARAGAAAAARPSAP